MSNRGPRCLPSATLSALAVGAPRATSRNPEVSLQPTDLWELNGVGRCRGITDGRDVAGEGAGM